MENGITRSLYRLLPFMFLFQFFGLVSIFFVVMAAGGLDIMNYSDVRGFNATLILLPFAFVLTILNLLLFPKLKTEEPAMLLFLVEIILNGALAVQALSIWRWLGW
jgi:hypothetical protein